MYYQNFSWIIMLRGFFFFFCFFFLPERLPGIIWEVLWFLLKLCLGLDMLGLIFLLKDRSDAFDCQSTVIRNFQTSHLFHRCCYLFCHCYSLNYSLYHFLVLARIFENLAKLSNILGFRKWSSQPMRAVIFQMLFKFLNVSIIVPWVEIPKTYLQ